MNGNKMHLLIIMNEYIYIPVEFLATTDKYFVKQIQLLIGIMIGVLVVVLNIYNLVIHIGKSLSHGTALTHI